MGCRALPLLHNWRWDNYQQDLRFGVGYHLNQASKRLHSIDVGDSLWAFTRRPDDGAYVLVAELVARAKTINHPSFRYGRHRLWGDLASSRYFLADGQPRIDHVIRSLTLDVQAKYIGQAFQGKAAVRTIIAEDHAKLAAVAAQLPREPRARLIPEECFEALALAGDHDEVKRLLAADGPGLAAERQSYLYSPAVSRARSWTRELRDRYEDRCQLCGWSSLGSYQEEVCEAHHMHWRSRGGPDKLHNLVLLCPNHHRVVHRTDAVFDYQDLAFVFTERHREPLQEAGHLAS